MSQSASFETGGCPSAEEDRDSAQGHSIEQARLITQMNVSQAQILETKHLYNLFVSYIFYYVTAFLIKICHMALLLLNLLIVLLFSHFSI